MATPQKRILILESERAYLHALQLKLSKEQYLVSAYHQGLEGMEELKREKFDLIITELLLSDVNGFFILESIRDMKIKTPIMVLSHLSQEEDKKKVADLGGKMFLEKSSTTIVEIIKKVKEII